MKQHIQMYSVCIHLDHGDSYETMVRAIRAGMTSVMIDASTLPCERKCCGYRKVVETAHSPIYPLSQRLGAISTTGNSIEGRYTGCYLYGS